MQTIFNNTKNTSTLHRKLQRGFTLVELLVSVFIFSVVMTISMGTLLVLIDANQKGQGIQAVMTNLSFALDSMTRNIRTGHDYYCESVWDLWADKNALPDYGYTNDCTYDPDDPGRIIAYVDGRTGNRVAFRYNPDDGSIERKVDIYQNGTRDDEGEWLRVTASELFVTDFVVAVEGSMQSETEQPTAQLFIEGYIVDEPNTDPDFQLQTTITQRTLDF